MLKRILYNTVVVAAILIPGMKVLMAQQEPQFTQNMFSISNINPGNYGMTDGICVTGVMREQWLGFKDENGNKVSPETFVISGDAPIRFLRGGVGMTIVQDKYGFFKDMTLKLGYSYHKTLGTGKIGIGINGSFLNKSVDFGDNMQAVNPDDPVLTGFTSSEGVIFSDLSAGLFIQQPKYYLSVSSTQLLETSRYLSKTGQSGQFKLRRHYFLTGGYDLAIPAYPGYVITPSVFMKSDGNTFQVDLNTLVTYNKKIWAGASYRLGDAFALMVGYKFNDIEIGYSYDVPMSRVGATGSHEVVARYIFKIEREKVRTGYRNTRFL